MPLARLELAPRVDPDWILSPTRLPIPPLEQVQNLEPLNSIIKTFLSQEFYLNNFLNLSIASIVFSLEPKEVSLKYPSPFLPNPAPGVPTT